MVRRAAPGADRALGRDAEVLRCRQRARQPSPRDFLLFVLFTGLRLSEASSIRWEDVDLPLRVIRVTAARTKAGRKLDLPMSDL